MKEGKRNGKICCIRDKINDYTEMQMKLNHRIDEKMDALRVKEQEIMQLRREIQRCVDDSSAVMYNITMLSEELQRLTYKYSRKEKEEKNRAGNEIEQMMLPL